MLEKGKIYEAVISDYTAEGQGVAKIDGCAVFIPNAIAGERVLVTSKRSKKPGQQEKSQRYWKNLPTG